MDFITIDGVSSETVNVWIDTPPMPPKAKKKTQTISIPGREDVVVSNGEYEDVEVKITAYVFERDYDPKNLYDFIEDAKALKTSISDNYYYRVKKVNGVTPNYIGHGKYRLDLSFLCSPYRYNTSNAKQTKTVKSFTIANSGTVYAQPVYTVYGSGEIKLKVNDDANTITVYNVNGQATIDCERLIAYGSDNKPLVTSGLFPFLSVGNNTVTITGSVTKTEYYMNSRWL